MEQNISYCEKNKEKLLQYQKEYQKEKPKYTKRHYNNKYYHTVRKHNNNINGDNFFCVSIIPESNIIEF